MVRVPGAGPPGPKRENCPFWGQRRRPSPLGLKLLPRGPEGGSWLVPGSPHSAMRRGGGHPEGVPEPRGHGGAQTRRSPAGRLQALNELFDLPDLHVPVGSSGVICGVLIASSLRAQSLAAEQVSSWCWLRCRTLWVLHEWSPVHIFISRSRSELHKDTETPKD